MSLPVGPVAGGRPSVAVMLVAHSPGLADGLAATIAQAAPGVRVAVAAGTDTGALGTSMPAVLRALDAALAAEPGGVVILLDLNSAVLAVEMALEELAPPQRERVRVSRGPLVEGSIDAAVAAAAGQPLDAVLAASQGSVVTGKLPDDWPADGRAPRAGAPS